MPWKEKEGFTLLELLITVAVLVIVIIAAIAFPSFRSARFSAQEDAAAPATRSISTGEYAFRACGLVDADGNGDSDFGTLQQLANPGSLGSSQP